MPPVLLSLSPSVRHALSLAALSAVVVMAAMAGGSTAAAAPVPPEDAGDGPSYDPSLPKGTVRVAENPSAPAKPQAQPKAPPQQQPQTATDAGTGEDPVPRPMYIRQFRVQGSQILTAEEVQTAVYPYLGPGRLPGDVDKARKALEEAYKAKGYKAAQVSVPVQKIRQGVIMLKVEENPIGRLRVRGAQYTSAKAIESTLPALKEGEPINFDALQDELVASTQYPGRQVTPKLKPGVEPGTVDLDLEVKDQNPLHGSLELNNRYSSDTTPLRVNGSLNYDNLWQLGHSLGLNFQVAPENIKDAEVFSAAYTIRSPHTDGWSFMLQGTKQNSDISTLGGSSPVVGKGYTLGLRAMKTLPQTEHYSQSLSIGFDYKHLDEFTIFSGYKPVTYYPFSLLYTSTYKEKNDRTDLNAGVNFHIRGTSSMIDFENKRYNADGGYIYLRADLSHTHDLNTGYQWFAKVQGQASNEPLINSEQFAAGGLGSVRGYMESEALGDDALFGTFEFRSPSLIGKGWSEADDLRAYAFFDGGWTSIHDALPGQSAGEHLSSTGVGIRGRLYDHFNGSLDAAYPLFARPSGIDQRLMYTFRLWGDF